MSPREEGSLLPLLITGTIAALIGGGVWAGVTIVTGYEVGWIAWGIGLVVGFGVLLGAQGHPMAPPAAAGFAVLGLVVGKLMIMQFGVAASFADEVVTDNELMVEALLTVWADRGEIDPATVEALEKDGPLTPQQEQELVSAWEDAQQVVSKMSLQEREEVAATYTSKLLGQLSLMDKLNFNLFDLLWFGLAIVTAFRVAAGARD